MRKTVLVVLAAFSVIVSVMALPSSAAAKPAYKVSLTTSVTKSTAGKFIIVSGKVTGPKAAGRNVVIQREYDGKPWVTVAVAKIKPNGKYSARVETPRGGTTAFRVLKAKSSVRKAGVSPIKAIPVYEWLYLANQGYTLDNGSVSTPISEDIGDKLYDRSMTFNDGDTEVGYLLKNLCTTFSTVAFYRTPGVGPQDQMSVGLLRYPFTGPPTLTSTAVTTEFPVTVSSSLVGTERLSIDLTSLDASNFMTLGNPRVYCNADHLPSGSNT